MLVRPILLAALTRIAFAAPADHLLADLDYGTFQGAYSSVYDIQYWQKIPYAAPPVGRNRFRAPQPPEHIKGIYDSTQTFDMCPQRTVNGSEDCLYLGLYSRPQTTSRLRPVVIAFHGGGFVQGTGAFTLPPSAYPILNVSSTDILFVYPNYRLNAFGFLPGRQIADDPHSDTNVGLRDQRAVLEWVKRHIKAFGGDPENVTIWGQSAGGGSVLAHTIAKQHEPLFAKAWASSPFWPKTYKHDSDEAQAIYDQLADLTGCAGPRSLQCLKRVDVQTIRDANLIIRDSHTYGTSTFTWAPVIDDDFLPRPLSAATATGHVNLGRGVSMYNTHEGESFIPPFNTSAPTFDDWVRGYLPRFNSRDIAKLKKLYPATGRTETEVYDTTFARAGMVYRDSVLACPAYWIADAAPDGGWLGEYTMSPSRHADDVYWWNSVNDAQEEDSLHYEGYSGAFASFFATGDPNKLKLTAPDVAGLPKLNTGKEWVIDEAGFDTVRLDELKTRCHFWRKMASKVSI